MVIGKRIHVLGLDERRVGKKSRSRWSRYHFGKPQQQALDRVDIATMTRYMQEGHFPPGSMLPKIIASLTFLEQGGKEVIITTPECLPAALRGETGTHIIKT